MGIKTRTPETQRLIELGVEYSVAEDKAFRASDPEAEMKAQGGLEAVAKALAIVAHTDEGTAMEAILVALDQED